MDRPPFVLSPYDAELFGHWWYEGPQFLDFFFRKAVYDQTSVKLTTPGPSREHLQTILKAGTRAPDHGRLTPWRFVVIEGAAREKLGDAMAEMHRQRFPDSTDDELQRERQKAMRAPTIVG